MSVFKWQMADARRGEARRGPRNAAPAYESESKEELPPRSLFLGCAGPLLAIPLFNLLLQSSYVHCPSESLVAITTLSSYMI